MSDVHALIIEDNRMNIDVLRMMLSSEGVESTAVDSPRLVQQTLDRLERIDVIFLDLEFPNADGFKLLPALKSEPRLANVPIVAYTVHVSEIDVARHAGFHSFLGKPLDAQRFPGQLQRILDNQPVWEIP